MVGGKAYRFHEIFREEVDAINERRQALHRTNLVTLEDEPRENSGRLPDPDSARGPETVSPASGAAAPEEKKLSGVSEPILRPTANSNLVGLHCRAAASVRRHSVSAHSRRSTRPVS
jgi:hypothetical protein